MFSSKRKSFWKEKGSFDCPIREQSLLDGIHLSAGNESFTCSTKADFA